MKFSTLMIAVALSIAAPYSFAGQVALTGLATDQTIAHSGGCRKDSPQGQCCHAGSKPYHCH